MMSGTIIDQSATVTRLWSEGKGAVRDQSMYNVHNNCGFEREEENMTRKCK